MNGGPVTRGRRVRALVVGHDGAARFLANASTPSRFTVDCIQTPEAVSAFALGSYDVIVVNARLGEHFIFSIARKEGTTPVVVLGIDPSEALGLIAAGIQDYVTRVEDIVFRVVWAIERHHRGPSPVWVARDTGEWNAAVRGLTDALDRIPLGDIGGTRRGSEGNSENPSDHSSGASASS